MSAEIYKELKEKFGLYCEVISIYQGETGGAFVFILELFYPFSESNLCFIN
jgi:hypothetical protein